MGRWCRDLAIAATLGLLACARVGTFVCEDSSDCNDGSFTGICQPNGYCSFGDASCESGQRYGELAGDDLAGTCVPTVDGTTGDGDPTTTGVGTTVSTLDGASLEGGDTTSTESGTLEGALEDTGTTAGPTAEVTTDDPTMVSDSMESDTNETLDSGPQTSGTNGPCDGLGEPATECDACLVENCCEQLLACAADEVCVCALQCQMQPNGPDTCEFECGQSPAYLELQNCVSEACQQICDGLGP